MRTRRRQGTHRVSGTGQRLVTSSKRRWMRGMGHFSPPLRSEDGNEIHWRGIYVTSSGWREWKGCGLETGHARSSSPDFWRSLKRTNPKAWRRRYRLLRDWRRRWAGCPQWYELRIGTWSSPSSSSGRRRSEQQQRNGHKSTTSPGCAKLLEVRQTGRQSRWHACQWDTACGDPKPGVQWDKGVLACDFSGQSPGGGVKSKSWGPGAASGCNFWSNSGPSRDSTPTEGPGTGQETRWVRPWSASSGGGGEDHQVARVSEIGGGPTQAHGCPHADHHALGGVGRLGGSQRCTRRPPPDGNSPDQAKSRGQRGVDRMAGSRGITSARAVPSHSGPLGSGRKSTMPRAKVHDILGDGMRQPRVPTEKGAALPPQPPGGGGVQIVGVGGGRHARCKVAP